MVKGLGGGSAWVYEDPEDFSASLWVINDTLDAFPDAKLNWQIDTEAGQQVAYGEIGVDVSADSSKRVWTISSNRITEGAHKITLTLSTRYDQILGENQFSFIVHPQTGDINE